MRTLSFILCLILPTGCSLFDPNYPPVSPLGDLPKRAETLKNNADPLPDLEQRKQTLDAKANALRASI